jgi:hypothetical protein
MNTQTQKLPNRFRVNLGFFRPLKFRERIKILIGYNLACDVSLLVDKRSGQVWNHCEVRLTKQATLTEQQLAEQEVCAKGKDE